MERTDDREKFLYNLFAPLPGERIDEDAERRLADREMAAFRAAAGG